MEKENTEMKRNIQIWKRQKKQETKRNEKVFINEIKK